MQLYLSRSRYSNAFTVPSGGEGTMHSAREDKVLCSISLLSLVLSLLMILLWLPNSWRFEFCIIVQKICQEDAGGYNCLS